MAQEIDPKGWTIRGVKDGRLIVSSPDSGYKFNPRLLLRNLLLAGLSGTVVIWFFSNLPTK